MTDLTAIIAERDDWKRRAEANHAACEAMRRQLEEEREALRICSKDRDRLRAERDSWKAQAIIGRAKFGVEQ